MKDLDETAERAAKRALAAVLVAAKAEERAAQQKRKDDTRRKIILGSVLLSWLPSDERLRGRLKAALKEHFATSPKDEALFEEFWDNLALKEADAREVATPARGPSATPPAPPAGASSSRSNGNGASASHTQATPSASGGPS